MVHVLASLAAVVALLIGSPPAFADPPAAGLQETRVVGTAPDLAGRWLLVATLGQGGGRSSATLWDVTSDAAGLQVRERHVGLPPAQRAELERGGWTPSPADLDAIASAWDALVPVERGIARTRHEILGPDGFDDTVRNDPLSAGALWIARQSYAFAPGGSRPSQEHRIFVATAREGDGWAGKYADATIAMVPMPMPITLEGSFRLVRLPAAPRSLWTRLADVFRGCN